MRSFRHFMISLLLLVAAFGAAVAQESNTRPYWGVRAALDLNLPGKWHGDAGSVAMYKSGAGVTLGAVYNIYLGSGFYLEPGASLFYDTYSYKHLVLADDDGPGVESDPSLYKIGLRVPVVVGYSFNVTDRFAMSVYAGPELSYAFAGDIRIKDKEALDGYDFSLFGKGGGQRRVDCAMKVGVGFPVDEWFISVDAAIGMTDLLKTGMSFRENRCSIGVTRYF